MKINKKWHIEHRMPRNATIEQRIRWHLDHVKHCQCRPVPDKLLEEMKKRGVLNH